MQSNQPASHSVKDLIARYNRELMDTYQQQTPAATNWLDEQFPVPDPDRDRAAIATAAASATEPPAPNEPPVGGDPTFPYRDEDLAGQPPYPMPAPSGGAAPASGGYVGYLQVFVTTADTAEPLAGARVTVTRPQGDAVALFANAETDRDGKTPPISLPSVDPALTMTPSAVPPYVLYDIRVDADGYVPTVYEAVPVYGNDHVTQPAAMIPLIPGEPVVPRVFRSGAPTNL